MRSQAPLRIPHPSSVPRVTNDPFLRTLFRVLAHVSVRKNGSWGGRGRGGGGTRFWSPGGWPPGRPPGGRPGARLMLPGCWRDRLCLLAAKCITGLHERQLHDSRTTRDCVQAKCYRPVNGAGLHAERPHVRRGPRGIASQVFPWPGGHLCPVTFAGPAARLWPATCARSTGPRPADRAGCGRAGRGPREAQRCAGPFRRDRKRIFPHFRSSHIERPPRAAFP